MDSSLHFEATAATEGHSKNAVPKVGDVEAMGFREHHALILVGKQPSSEISHGFVSYRTVQKEQTVIRMSKRSPKEEGGRERVRYGDNEELPSQHKEGGG